MINREIINSKISKRAIVLDASGAEYSVDNVDDMKKLCDKFEILKDFIKEEKGENAFKEMPPSIKVMQKLELVDYEPASDSGHFRFYPKGALIFDLIKEWADEIALNRLNAVKIETPLMYNYDEPDIRAQVESFHERHYVINSPDGEDEFILRFAADFGLFRMMKTAKLSYRDLPLRVYEYSKSFRYEKSGELAGLKRLRAFSMPDIHSFCGDIKDGFKEYKEIYKRYYDLAKAMDIKFIPVFRAVDKFYYEHKNEILELVQYGGLPSYIELLSDMKHYWAIKSEFQSVDCNKGFMQLSTVQLDVKDADIYGISYMDNAGEKKGCIICHSSIGSIERWIYAILEASMMKNKSELPYWLCPEQLRLIPVGDQQISYCKNLAEVFLKNGIRVNIDDRDDRLGKKIKNAEQCWIPNMIVVGEREIQSERLSLRDRSGNEFKDLSCKEIVHLLNEKQGEMPFKKLNLNLMLSKQPIFRG